MEHQTADPVLAPDSAATPTPAPVPVPRSVSRPPPSAPSRAAAEGSTKRTPKPKESVAPGLEEVQVWLAGLVRQGLACVRLQPAQIFETMAAHLATAHAPGIARRLRTWPAIFASASDDWASRALEEMGRLQLLLNAAARLDELPDGPGASVRSAIGWPVQEAVLLADPGAETVADQWYVVGQRVSEDHAAGAGQGGPGSIQRTWLVGETTGRNALCQVSVSADAEGTAAAVTGKGGKRREPPLAPGTVIDADLTFYPGPAALRAAVSARRKGGNEGGGGEPRVFTEPPAAALADFDEALAFSAALLAGDPWLDHSPWLVRGCIPRLDHAGTDAGGNTTGAWSLRDRRGVVVPLSCPPAHAWPLLAVSAGAPVTVFGEWDGRALLPLGVMAEGRFAALGGSLS